MKIHKAIFRLYGGYVEFTPIYPGEDHYADGYRYRVFCVPNNGGGTSWRVKGRRGFNQVNAEKFLKECTQKS